NLVPRGRGRPQQLTRPEHRDRKQGSVRGPGPVCVLGVGPDIVNVDGAPLESSPPRGTSASRRNGILTGELSVLRSEIVGGHDAKHLTVEAPDDRLLGLAQSE